jgi:hypothetical protein
MAKGRAIGRFEAVLGFFGVVALVVTYALITGWNPLPQFNTWLAKVRALSTPAPAWSVQVGDQPRAAVVTTSAILLTSRGTVEARNPATGDKIWSREVAWVGVAGSDTGGGTVVIAGQTDKNHGYDAVDPGTGAVVWSAKDAIGVWTFTDLVVDVACPQALLCTLTGRTPATGHVRWRTDLPGNGRTLSGANKSLSGVRQLAKLIAPPQPAPLLLGFPVDDAVQVVTSASGRRLHSYQATQTTWVTIAGDRVLISTALYRSGNCRFSVEARDPDGNRRTWQLSGYDLRTSSGLGCEQRDAPLGGGGLIDAIAPDNRDVLLNPSTGRVVYRAATGQTILATDGNLVMVRAPGNKSVSAISLSSGATRWQHPVAKTTQLGIGPAEVLFSDPGAEQLASVASANGQSLVTAKSGATVLGYARNGLVINVGRQVGLLTYPGAAG